MRRLLPVLSLFFLTGCYMCRAIKWGVPKVEDRDNLPHELIASSTNAFQINNSQSPNHGRWIKFLDSILPISKTAAFLIIKNDSVQYEYYGQNYSPKMQLNGFSMSKSFIGALYGIAVQEGTIPSTQVPFTNYLPEFLQKDSAFGKVTIQHLLDMRSGIKLRYKNVKMAAMKHYYGRNMKRSLKDIYVAEPPGKSFEYENANSQLLAWILEKVTGKPLENYLKEKLWEPLGMESDAYWTIDDKKHKNVKAYCCLFATARDFAKLGLLYLDSGRFNGRQIVPKKWIAQTISLDTMIKMEYKNQWWGMVHYQVCKDSAKCMKEFRYSECTKNVIPRKGTTDSIFWRCSYYAGDFCAEGLFNQYIYVNPKNNIVIVRLGNNQAHARFYSLVRTLGWKWN